MHGWISPNTSHGFQVFLPAKPTAKQWLDYDALDLRPFEPGSLIRFGGKFHRFADPWRRPQHALATALSPNAVNHFFVATLARAWILFADRETPPSGDDSYEEILHGVAASGY